MLLKELYDLAHSRNLLDDLAFAPKAVRWILELDASGNLVGPGAQITGDEKRGKEFLCPQTTRPKVAGGVAEFLADGLTAVFGLDPDPSAELPPKKRADREANNAAKQADFWRQIETAAGRTRHPGLTALTRFQQALPSAAQNLLRWGASPDAKAGTKPAWWVKTAAGDEARLGPENFTFRVNGSLLLEVDEIRDFWRAQHQAEAQAARDGYTRGLCLISGHQDQPLAPTHNPKIKGVPNTQSFGAAIVSFDKPAFSSYGFDQSLNAPAGEEAATAYCVALNWLLNQADHSLRIAQTTLCFWARKTESAGNLFAMLLNKPDPLSVASFIKSPWAGIQKSLQDKDDFFAVTLAGNSGRIVVKHWLAQPLTIAINNLQSWFADLDLEAPQRAPAGAPKKRDATDTPFCPLSVYWLAAATGRELKDVPSEVPAQLYRAALERSAPSLSLIKPLLDQFHSKLVCDANYQPLYDQSRFALLKLILNRNRKTNVMEIKPALAADTDDPAYNCGCLLAVLNETQKKAHEYGLKGATIAEKYFGTACASPSYVFPYLMKLNRHHLQKIGKSPRYAGDERFLEEAIFKILSRLGQSEDMKSKRIPPSFPRSLDLHAQGRFALGFYQQMAADSAARQSARKNNQNSESTTTN